MLLCAKSPWKLFHDGFSWQETELCFSIDSNASSRWGLVLGLLLHVRWEEFTWLQSRRHKALSGNEQVRWLMLSLEAQRLAGRCKSAWQPLSPTKIRDCISSTDMLFTSKSKQNVTFWEWLPSWVKETCVLCLVKSVVFLYCVEMTPVKQTKEIQEDWLVRSVQELDFEGGFSGKDGVD
jgi:hypothetical protein